MTLHRESTRLLVAVAAAIPQGLILAADGKNARREIVEMSCNPEEWSSLGDAMPKEPGFYVWEGEFVGEDGVGAGELGGQGDCDVWWEGEWRVAGVRDVLAFNFFHTSHACPRHGVERERDERGHLQCRECMADLGRASAARRAELRAHPEHLAQVEEDAASDVAPSPRRGRLVAVNGCEWCHGPTRSANGVTYCVEECAGYVESCTPAEAYLNPQDDPRR